MAWIYCIENKINSKKYIGKSTSSINHRWYDHKSKLKRNIHLNKHLQQSWNKYGEEFFTFYIIEECEKEKLSEREMFWIKQHKTFDYDGTYGYNLTKGGEGTLGKSCSKYTKDKIRKAKQGNTDWLGKHHTKETIQKMSNTKKGKTFSEEHKKKLSESRKGKISPRKNIKLSNETKIKMSKSKTGTKDSEKTKEIKSIAQKKRWEQYRRTLLKNSNNSIY